MSRRVIRQLVVPIVHRLFPNIVIDEQLITYLDRELTLNLGVIGRAGHCDELEAILLELLRRNPGAFQTWVQRLVDKYLEKRKASTVQETRPSREHTQDVPDRLREARRQAEKVWTKT